jgi:hypothetical protein
MGIQFQPQLVKPMELAAPNLDGVFSGLGAFKIVGGGLSLATAASKVCCTVEKITAA